MPLLGPRLDQPSAIGDEGRPRATSLAIASLVVVALIAVVGYTAGILQMTLAVATLTGLVTVGLALLNRERFLALFLGQLCYVLGGSMTIVLLSVFLVMSPAYGILMSGFALAMLGLATSWADVADGESAKTALFHGSISYVAMWIWVIVLLVSFGIVAAVLVLLTDQVGTASPTASLLGFLITVSLTSLFVWLGTRWLPVRQLTPREYRQRLDERLGQFRLAIALLAALAFVAVVVGSIVWALGVFDVFYAAVPPIATVFSGLSSPFGIGAMLSAGLAVLLAASFALVLRWITRPANGRMNRVLADIIGGFTLAVLFVPFLASFVPLPGGLLLVVAGIVMLLAPAALLVLGVLFLVAVEIEVLPGRVGGPAIAAAGMVVATIGAGLTGVPSPVVFACAVGGMVVWDVSAFGLGVTAELGHLPDTRRLELFHGVLGVGVGVLVIAVLTGIDVVRTTVAGGLVAGPAILVAVVGVLLLLLPVRG